MKQALFALTLAGLCVARPALAQDSRAKNPAPANQTAQKQIYLGLAVEKVPHALATQMPGIIPKGQGLLIMQVAKDSPAAKAGLKADDILLKYGDQNLSSPEQLVKLVRGDKSGHEVNMHFLRAGKPHDCKVTLQEHEVVNRADNSRVFRFLPDERIREMFEEYTSKNGSSDWESFDAMKLTRTDGKHWRAEIDYRGKDGKKEHKVFEGTRHEIRKAIKAETDLPASERRHLLRALNLQEPVFEFHFPPVFDQIVPDTGKQP